MAPMTPKLPMFTSTISVVLRLFVSPPTFFLHQCICYSVSLTHSKNLWEWLHYQQIHPQVVHYWRGWRYFTNKISSPLIGPQFSWLQNYGGTSGTWSCCTFWCCYTSCEDFFGQFQTYHTQSYVYALCAFCRDILNSLHFLKPPCYLC